MKKIITLIGTCLIISLLLVVPGNPVAAAENSLENVTYLGPPEPEDVEHPVDDDCTCHDLLPLSGSERNKIVAILLKSNAFKTEKMRLKKEGYKWNGASGIEVIQPEEKITLVGVPFINNEGLKEMHTFFVGDIMDFIAYMDYLEALMKEQAEKL